MNYVRITEGPVIARCDDYFDARVVVADMPKEFHAVHAVHDHVCQDNMKEILFQFFNGLAAIVGNFMLVPENDHHP